MPFGGEQKSMQEVHKELPSPKRPPQRLQALSCCHWTHLRAPATSQVKPRDKQTKSNLGRLCWQTRQTCCSSKRRIPVGRTRSATETQFWPRQIQARCDGHGEQHSPKSLASVLAPASRAGGSKLAASPSTPSGGRTKQRRRLPWWCSSSPRSHADLHPSVVFC